MGVRRRSAPFRSWSSLGFGLLEENRRAVQRFARLCLFTAAIDGRGARSHVAASRGGFLGSWVPLPRLPGVRSGFGLAAAKRGTWGVGSSPVVHSRLAVIGHRGALMLLSQGASGRISRLVSGASGPLASRRRAPGVRRPLEQSPAERPMPEWIVGARPVRLTMYADVRGWDHRDKPIQG